MLANLAMLTFLFSINLGRVRTTLYLLFLITLFSGQAMSQGKLGSVDPTSYSNFHEIAITDVGLYLDIDFKSQTLAGKAELTCLRKVDNPKTLVLDAKDLTVKNIFLSSNGKSLEFTVSEPYKTFGSALTVSIPEGAQNESLKIIVEYQTSPNASGLQWLTPEQTLGKKEPYMFSEFQAIHARSVVPCQDTPAVKFTYSAEISAPENLTVLMSALHEGEPITLDKRRRLAKFRQPVPIPSYLIAFAVGRLASKRLGPQSTVWTEPEALEASAYEFAEVDKMLQAAISLAGDYEWKVYDLLVMPPSFPFGGMENPCLTFVTPTVLAGDRSLVDVVAHEISHSWSGNLVTTKTFEHFWLNEGWTMFLERKIHEKLAGAASRHFDAYLGLQSLRETVESTLGPTSEFTKLVPNLNDTDPDDAFSVVPYEKGHTFLFYLEELLGGPDAFNPFIKAYFAKFKNQSITTEDFKETLTTFFKDNANINKIDWDTWLYQPGMPVVIPEYDVSLVEPCRELASAWQTGPAGKSDTDIKKLTSNQMILFLATLFKGDALPKESIERMNELYGLDGIKNYEIRFLWLRLGIKSQVASFVPKALDFINQQGRMKFVRPIYRDLYKWEEMRQVAVDNYHKNKSSMMFVLANQLLKDLHIQN